MAYMSVVVEPTLGVMYVTCFTEANGLTTVSCSTGDTNPWYYHACLVLAGSETDSRLSGDQAVNLAWLIASAVVEGWRLRVNVVV